MQSTECMIMHVRTCNCGMLVFIYLVILITTVLYCLAINFPDATEKL